MPSPMCEASGKIVVAYDMAGTNWKLSVSDDGIGKPDGVFAQGKSGLGTGIVQALSQQLDAQVDTSAGPTRHDGVDHPCHFPEQGRPRRVRTIRRAAMMRRYRGAPAAPLAGVVAAIGSPHCHSARIAEDVASIGRFAHPSDTSSARKAASGPFLWPRESGRNADRGRRHRPSVAGVLPVRCRLHDFLSGKS